MIDINDVTRYDIIDYRKKLYIIRQPRVDWAGNIRAYRLDKNVMYEDLFEWDKIKCGQILGNATNLAEIIINKVRKK